MNFDKVVSEALEFLSIKMSRIDIQVRNTNIRVEVATEPDELSAGLMGRKNLLDGEGMLFVFDRPQKMYFWMKGTAIPLSIAYIDPSGKIQEIYDLFPFDQESTVSKSEDLLYALEVPQGWFTKNNIIIGDVISNLPINT